MAIIKWVASLTKLYPMANNLMGQRQHPTFRHPPKTQILREYRLPRRVYSDAVCEGKLLWMEKNVRLERNIHNIPELKGLRPESTKPSSVSDF